MRFRLLLTALVLSVALAFGGCDTTDVPVAKVAVEDVKPGTGAAATRGDRLRVAYEGAVLGKQVFDAGTFTFVLGRGEIMAGLELGIEGMRRGGMRRITIPPALGYGAETLRAANGATLVPSGSTLVYSVELLDVSEGAAR